MLGAVIAGTEDTALTSGLKNAVIKNKTTTVTPVNPVFPPEPTPADDSTDAALTSSIANGIALGFISYPIMKFARGKIREVHPLVYVFAILFLYQLVFLASK